MNHLAAGSSPFSRSIAGSLFKLRYYIKQNSLWFLEEASNLQADELVQLRLAKCLTFRLSGLGTHMRVVSDSFYMTYNEISTHCPPTLSICASFLDLMPLLRAAHPQIHLLATCSYRQLHTVVSSSAAASLPSATHHSKDPGRHFLQLMKMLMLLQH